MFSTIEPFESGMLDVGDSQQIYWEYSGNPRGRPVIYLHGGPGSGSRPNGRRLFDPAIYKIILADQRGCGQSSPRVETLDDLIEDAGHGGQSMLAAIAFNSYE